MFQAINPFKRRSLDDRLNETKKINVCGVIFKIRKFSTLDYMDGSDALRQIYKTYTVGGKEIDKVSVNKIKKHYTDVFMASVLEPKLARKKADKGAPVDGLFNDWELAHELYEKVCEFTYGKKKTNKSI